MSPSEKPERPSTLELGSQPPVTRRGFLTSTLACAVLGGPTIARHLRQTPRAESQTGLTPDAALRELVAGNARFVAEHLTSTDHDLQILRSHTADKQEPFAGVLACADSRVPVELIFDQSIGRVFVTRVAGNIVTPEIIASLEYGAAVLGVKVILVMGHGSCGAVEAALEGKGAPGQISALYPHLQPAIDQAGPDLEGTTKANAKLQADLLRKPSPVLSGLIKEGKLLILSAYYNIASGEVTLLDQDTDQEMDTSS